MVLPVEIKNNMHELIREGMSINCISKTLGLWKSTIYYHYKSIKGRKILKPKFTIAGGEVEGEIIGAFASDGSACPQADYHISFYFGKDEIEYAQDFAGILHYYFNKRPYFYQKPEKSVIVVSYRSKDIYHKFIKHYLEWREGEKKTYSVKLRELPLSKQFLVGFLRGCLDCDGYAKGRVVQFGGVSKAMLLQIKKIVEDLQFNLRFYTTKDKRPNCADMHYVKIAGDDTKRFLELIKPRNKKRMGLPGLSHCVRSTVASGVSI